MEKEENAGNDEKKRIRKFFGKIIFWGKIKVLTGLRIGAPGEIGEIGGIDNPVIRDPVTGEPYIPGSSLKGKLRSLFERYYAPISGLPPATGKECFFNNPIGDAWIHVCKTYEEAKKCPVCRLFGSSGEKGNFPARLIFRDSFLTEESRRSIREQIPTYTEAKTEVAIDRVTSVANPRTNERVVPGTEFEVEIVYNVESTEQLKEDLKEDLRNLATSLRLLEDSYLGGNGSRGYGKVKIKFNRIVFRSLKYYKSGSPDEELILDEGDIEVAEFHERVEDYVNKILAKLNEISN